MVKDTEGRIMGILEMRNGPILWPCMILLWLFLMGAFFFNTCPIPPEILLSKAKLQLVIVIELLLRPDKMPVDKNVLVVFNKVYLAGMEVPTLGAMATSM